MLNSEMNSDPGGLSGEVRRQLRDGVPPAAVIEDLVGRGLSRVAAERFVERARADAGSPAAAPKGSDRVDAAPPAAVSSHAPHAMTDSTLSARGVAEAPQSLETDAGAMQAATRDLIHGGLGLAAGIAITVLSFEMPRARLMVGLVIWGLWVFGRGVYRCTQLDGPFPLRRVLLAAAIPGGVVIALGVYGGSKRAADVAASGATTDVKIYYAVKTMYSGKPDAQCEAALELGRLKATKEAHALLMLGMSARARHARGCAASALFMIGESHSAHSLYMTWAEGTDPELRRMAIAGFGEMGPAAGPRGMAFLTEALQSSDAEIRNLASVAISRIQSSAAQDAPTGQ